MKAIAIVGSTNQSQPLLADLLHWHGLSIFQVDSNDALLPLLSFISPELIIIESSGKISAEAICDRIRHSSVLGHLPIIICTSWRSNDGNADAYIYEPYTAEEIFANIQALRPLDNQLSNSIVAQIDF